jgi:YD repeat-containing protein
MIRRERPPRVGLRVALCATCACTVSMVRSAETTTFTYDVHGRLTNVLTSGGPANGVERAYQSDATDNRLSFVLSGASGGGTVTIAAQGSIANATSAGVAIGVNMSGTPPPTGTVTFTENGVFLGSAFIYEGQASVLLEGFSMGSHAITASYSGDGA